MDSRIIDLEKKVAGQEVLLSRVDTALDKISEVSLNVSKLLAVHEQRIETQEEVTRNLPNLVEKRRQETKEAIDEVHSRVSSSEQRLRTEMAEGQKEILREIKGLRTEMSDLGDELIEKTDNLKTDVETKIEAVNTRVNKLERLAWLVIGGATVIGFIISQTFGLFSGYFTGG